MFIIQTLHDPEGVTVNIFSIKISRKYILTLSPTTFHNIVITLLLACA